jgi:hypothetical protein
MNPFSILPQWDDPGPVRSCLDPTKWDGLEYPYGAAERHVVVGGFLHFIYRGWVLGRIRVKYDDKDPNLVIPVCPDEQPE